MFIQFGSLLLDRVLNKHIDLAFPVSQLHVSHMTLELISYVLHNKATLFNKQYLNLPIGNYGFMESFFIFTMLGSLKMSSDIHS